MRSAPRGLALAIAAFASSAAGGQGAGPAPTRTDMSPAAPTAATGPDAGQTYKYPPTTGAILPPESRTPYSGTPSSSETRANEPVSKAGAETVPSK